MNSQTMEGSNLSVKSLGSLKSSLASAIAFGSAIGIPAAMPSSIDEGIALGVSGVLVAAGIALSEKSFRQTQDSTPESLRSKVYAVESAVSKSILSSDYLELSDGDKVVVFDRAINSKNSTRLRSALLFDFESNIIENSKGVGENHLSEIQKDKNDSLRMNKSIASIASKVSDMVADKDPAYFSEHPELLVYKKSMEFNNNGVSVLITDDELGLDFFSTDPGMVENCFNLADALEHPGLKEELSISLEHSVTLNN